MADNLRRGALFALAAAAAMAVGACSDEIKAAKK